MDTYVGGWKVAICPNEAARGTFYLFRGRGFLSLGGGLQIPMVLEFRERSA